MMCTENESLFKSLEDLARKLDWSPEGVEKAWDEGEKWLESHRPKILVSERIKIIPWKNTEGE